MTTATTKAAIAGLLLAAGAASPAAIAMESPAAGLTDMLGIYILSQGNQALDQIRADLKKNLLSQLRPYLPKPDVVVPDTAPTKTTSP